MRKGKDRNELKKERMRTTEGKEKVEKGKEEGKEKIQKEKKKDFRKKRGTEK